jgi:hypothetical protein
MSQFPVYIPTAEAAKALNLSRRTLEKMRLQGRGPVYRKLGSRVVYAMEDLTAWADANLRRSTSDPGPGQAPLPANPAA